MARVTVYDKTTGARLYTGGRNDPKTKRLKQAGHVIVPGVQKRRTKWDAATSKVVPDAAMVQADSDRETNELVLRARATKNKGELLATVGSNRNPAQLNADLDKLIQLLERP